MPSSDFPMISPTDLRGILKYVPRFQDQIFVIAIDGSVVADDNFGNILIDIAVLRSLSIQVVLVHGIGFQLATLARTRHLEPSDVHGLGGTDAHTLRLAVEASAMVSHDLMGGLTQVGLRCALTTAVRSTPVGVVGGKDHRFSGKIDRVDQGLLSHLIAGKIVPVVSPIGFDRHGKSLRINSDLLATELAIALHATKIIFLAPAPGLEIEENLQRHIPVERLHEILQHRPESIKETLRSKAHFAVKAIDAGIPRVHLVDGRIYEGLLTEIFSNEGIGTLIYGNEYQQIRPAGKRDVRSIYNLTRHAVKREELVRRSLQQIEKNIGHYYVFEIDETIVACTALTFYPEEKMAELSSLYVLPSHQRSGMGKKMVSFACMEARNRGAERLFALSTQSSSFFKSICQFEETGKEILPPARRTHYEESARNSKILVRQL